MEIEPWEVLCSGAKIGEGEGRMELGAGQVGKKKRGRGFHIQGGLARRSGQRQLEWATVERTQYWNGAKGV